MKKKTTAKKTKTKKTTTKKTTVKKIKNIGEKKVLKIYDNKKTMVNKVTIEFDKKDIKLITKIFCIAAESKKISPSNVAEMEKIISLFYK